VPTTSRPSDSPTNSPTNSPSTSPTAAPTASPSSRPSPLPSSSPSEFECVAEGGVFGDVSAGTPTPVTFAYSLEVRSGALIEDVVLPELEQGIVDSVLSEIFGDQCGTRRRSLRVHISRKLAVAGISRLPPDEILTGVTCEGTVNTNHECVFVSGILTLYEDGNGESGAATVKEAIKRDMDSGAFDTAQADIVKVSYVELSPTDNAGRTTAQGDTTSDPQVGNPSGVRVGLLVGGVLVMAAVVGLAYRQRHKTDSEDGEETELGTQPPQAEEDSE